MDIYKHVFKVVVACIVVWCVTAEAGETSEQKKNRVRAEKIEADAHQRFVKLHYYFKKSNRPEFEDNYFSFSFSDNDVQEKVLQKKTVIKSGVIISKEGDIFSDEDSYTPDVIDKIIVEMYDGVKLECRKKHLLTYCSGQILRVVDSLPSSWKPLDFDKAPKAIDVKDNFYAAALSFRDHADSHMPWLSGEECQNDIIHISHVSPVTMRNNTTKKPDYLQAFGGQVQIIYNHKARPIGITCHRRINLNESSFKWLGEDILADPGVSLDDYERRVQNVISKYLYLVRINFRPPPNEEEDEMGIFGGFLRQFSFSDDTSDREISIYGLAFGQRKILLPMMTDQVTMAGVDTIEVQIGTSYYPASFCGVLKDIEATVIEINPEAAKKPIPHCVDLNSLGTLSRYQPFWTVFVRDLAGKDFWIEPCRWVTREKGYQDKYYRTPENSVRRGSWLLTANGELAGLYTGARMEYDRFRSYLIGENHHFFGGNRIQYGSISGNYFNDDENPTRLFDSPSLANILKDCSNHFDPHIRHLDKDEQKRRCWLGVEFAEVTKEMAIQMDLRKKTYDGRIGLIVNRVYPDSPASQIGLQEGDILLRVKINNAPWPIDLKMNDNYDYEMPDWDDVDMPDEFEVMGYSMPRKRPWPSRDNFLTRMLFDIGQGELITLTFLHEGKEYEKDVQIQMSPRDFLSASKYKNEKIGLTVKDLTYEVRSALRLKPDQAGIIIAKVEQGTPAALARVRGYELIRAVNGEDVDSVEVFKEKIEAAKDSGQESVRMTVEWMGKTRLADLKFDAKQPEMNNIFQLLPGMRNMEH